MRWKLARKLNGYSYWLSMLSVTSRMFRIRGRDGKWGGARIEELEMARKEQKYFPQWWLADDTDKLKKLANFILI